MLNGLLHIFNINCGGNAKICEGCNETSAIAWALIAMNTVGKYKIL